MLSTFFIINSLIIFTVAIDPWFYVDTNEGTSIPTPPFPDARLKYKMRGSQTNNMITTVELDLFNAGLGTHMHSREDEFYYVVDGQVQFMIDNKQFCGKPGDYVYVPRGYSRSLRIDEKRRQRKPVRIQIVLFPSGVEGFLDDIAAYFMVGGNNNTVSNSISNRYGLSNLPPVTWEELGCFKRSQQFSAEAEW